MMYLFWEADRDFSFVIFETPEPVCEPRLLVFIVHGSDGYLKHFLLFSSPCLMEQQPYFWIRQGQASVCGFQRFTRDQCESELMLYHTHITAVIVSLHVSPLEAGILIFRVFYFMLIL